MAEGALRCFATLSDRYTRRSVDPEPLSQHGLIDELLKRLGAAGGPTNLNTSLPSGGGQTPDPKSSGEILFFAISDKVLAIFDMTCLEWFYWLTIYVITSCFKKIQINRFI